MSTRAERLGVTGGLVWIIGRSDEENALLDPLPDGVETIAERDEDDPEEIAAAVVVLDDMVTLADDLDDALPRIGSVSRVWLALSRDLDRGVVSTAVTDYGWQASEQVALDSNWIAVRVSPG